jgi:hypothetical protein
MSLGDMTIGPKSFAKVTIGLKSVAISGGTVMVAELAIHDFYLWKPSLQSKLSFDRLTFGELLWQLIKAYVSFIERNIINCGLYYKNIMILNHTLRE